MAGALAPQRRITSALVRNTLARAGARSYSSSVAGLKHRAPDGTNRAAYAMEQVRPGDLLTLTREPPSRKSERAVAFWHDDVQLGHVPEEQDWVSDAIEQGQYLIAVVVQIVADDEDNTIARSIRVEIAVSPRPIVDLVPTAAAGRHASQASEAEAPDAVDPPRRTVRLPPPNWVSSTHAAGSLPRVPRTWRSRISPPRAAFALAGLVLVVIVLGGLGTGYRTTPAPTTSKPMAAIPPEDIAASIAPVTRAEAKPAEVPEPIAAGQGGPFVPLEKVPMPRPHPLRAKSADGQPRLPPR